MTRGPSPGWHDYPLMTVLRPGMGRQQVTRLLLQPENSAGSGNMTPSQFGGDPDVLAVRYFRTSNQIKTMKVRNDRTAQSCRPLGDIQWTNRGCKGWGGSLTFAGGLKSLLNQALRNAGWCSYDKDSTTAINVGMVMEAVSGGRRPPEIRRSAPCAPHHSRPVMAAGAAVAYPAGSRLKAPANQAGRE